MRYLIVNLKTAKAYKKPNHIGPAFYPTERGAKIAATKLNKKSKEIYRTWVAMSRKEFAEKYPVKMIERVNMMSGEKYMEAEDTPLCCSPASETYWSM